MTNFDSRMALLVQISEECDRLPSEEDGDRFLAGELNEWELRQILRPECQRVSLWQFLAGCWRQKTLAPMIGGDRP